MNDYRLFTQAHVKALNDSCTLVNEWADKKGWNDPKTPEQINIDHQIAALTIEIADSCREIEKIRKGWQVTLLYPRQELTDEQAADLAQMGLFVTEIAEAAEAVMFSKEYDDHCPELPAVEAEGADLFIRLCHFMGKRGMKLGDAVQVKHAYNTQRPHKHGKKA